MNNVPENPPPEIRKLLASLLAAVVNLMMSVHTPGKYARTPRGALWPAGT
ncbi:MAG: hypothetical protein NTV33_11180 [Coprothermobacterota bacterium]|nr:hypothetical protein [Coprothermobacterota bacterium]